MDRTIKFRIQLETNGETVLHNLEVNADDFREAVSEAVKETKDLSTAIEDIAHSGMAFVAIKDAIEAVQNVVNGLADEFNKFDKGMRAVNTMAGLSADELDNLKGKVEEIADVVPLAKEELANGLYQVISNGVPKDNWIEFLRTSSRSAVGGIADLGQTVTVTSTIIKNYALEWSEAGAIQDKIQMTAKNGVTSFEQLAQALPRVTGNAATLGVSIDELLAAFATLTGVSGNTAEVSTQLAAIFTALVKPSSEASEMAEQMGIKFDAAAIQAAGGMKEFLSQLSADITQYASANGMLEQEVYGKLFGSAEAIRALIPLTGELADTYESNVSAMAGSSGTMDAAFENMAGSGESVTQMLHNQLSSMMDWAGGIASSIQPYLTFVAVGGQAIYGMILMASTAKKAAIAIQAFTAAHKSNAIVAALVAVHTKVVAAAQRLLAASSVTATAGTWALTAAVTALYAAATLGISLIITGLVSLFSSMGDEAEEAAEKVDVLKESTDAFNQTTADTKAEIDMALLSLRNLQKGQGDEQKVVEDLNQKYGDALGYHKDAAEWYKVLIENSKVYCEQLGYEAQAKIIATQLAAKRMEYEEKMAKYLRLNQTYWDQNGKIHHNWEKEGGKDAFDQLSSDINQLYDDIGILQGRFDTATERMVAAAKQLKTNIDNNTDSVEWQSASYTRLGQLIEDQKKKVGRLAGVDEAAASKEAKLLQQMENRYKRLGLQYGLTTKKTSTKNQYNGDTLIEDAKSYSELGNNIKYYQRQLEKTATTDLEAIKRYQSIITQLQQEQDAIKAVYDAYGRPLELNSLEDIDKEIAYQQGLRRRASAENLAAIDAEIQRLNELKRTFEASSHTAIPIEKISTYEELGNELRWYEARLKHATAAERVEIQRQINALKELQQEWDQTLEEVEAPGDITTLENIEKLEEAISYYEQKIKRANASEIEGLQRTIEMLSAKRDAMQQLTELPAMQKEVADLGRLRGKELKMELKLIGLEEVKSKIRSLQKMLQDPNSKLDASQREEVQKLITAWKGYEKQIKKNNVKFADAWGNLKGIGNSITGITDAIKGNGNAWEKLTAVVDGAISLYESISGIISIIDTLTAVTQVQTGASIAQTAATVGTEAAQGMVAGTSEVAAAALLPMIAANKAATASYLELASAAYFAAHAYIPFAGFGIAAGFSAAAVAETKAIGLMAFANGGLVYGPTMGLIGEYSGASNNPEVVAPLDKLKNIIGDSGSEGSGKVEFVIDGRVLRGILNKTDRIRRRTE